MRIFFDYAAGTFVLLPLLGRANFARKPQLYQIASGSISSAQQLVSLVFLAVGQTDLGGNHIAWAGLHCLFGFLQDVLMTSRFASMTSPLKTSLFCPWHVISRHSQNIWCVPYA